jgi:teichuronic acid biosynthesis glycosyltransferase TuaG
MPLVSVVMAAMNAERFIAEALASVQGQSFGDWECLVVDDASSDATAAVAEGFAVRDPRIRLLRHASNRGTAAARNTALEAAVGRYVAFLDADDLWLPAKLERQVAFMQASDAALGYTAYRRIDESGTRVGRLVRVPAEMTWRRLLGNTAIATVTAMVDRERSGSFAMREMRRDDLVLWLTLLRRGCIARGLNEDLARYRLVPGSLSSRRLRSAAWVWRVYREEIGLSRPAALWYLGNYGTRAWWKRCRF